MRVAIFVNNSMGELDWIVPYIKQTSLDIHFDIYLYHQRLWDFDIQNKTDNINIICCSNYKNTVFLDTFLDNLYRYLARKIPFDISYVSTFFDFLRYFTSLFIILKYQLKYKYDFIFRDYNLKQSILLYKLSRKSKKVVIYPHSTALMTNYGKKPQLNKIKHAIFLENTEYHDRFLPYYAKNMAVVGSPGLDVIRQKKITNKLNSILIITRNCDESFFGFDYDSSFKLLRTILTWAKRSNLEVDIKHHPRDNRVQEWRRVSESFDNVNEINGNLSENNNSYLYCLCYYTSAFIPSVLKKTLCIDVSPYRSIYFKNLPYHTWNNGPHHEFSELKLLPIIEFDNFLMLNADQKKNIRDSQLNALNNTYPVDSSRAIDNLLIRHSK